MGATQAMPRAGTSMLRASWYCMLVQEVQYPVVNLRHVHVQARTGRLPCGVLQGASPQENRRKDLISHHILRLAYCRCTG